MLNNVQFAMSNVQLGIWASFENKAEE